MLIYSVLVSFLSEHKTPHWFFGGQIERVSHRFQSLETFLPLFILISIVLVSHNNFQLLQHTAFQCLVKKFTYSSDDLSSTGVNTTRVASENTRTYLNFHLSQWGRQRHIDTRVEKKVK